LEAERQVKLLPIDVAADLVRKEQRDLSDDGSVVCVEVKPTVQKPKAAEIVLLGEARDFDLDGVQEFGAFVRLSIVERELSAGPFRFRKRLITDEDDFLGELVELAQVDVHFPGEGCLRIALRLRDGRQGPAASSFGF
jgi:hypothetical protein